MAEETQAAVAAPKRLGGTLKLIIVGVVAALLGAVGAGAAFFLLGEHPPQAAGADAHADAGEGADGADGEGAEQKKKKKKKQQ